MGSEMCIRDRSNTVQSCNLRDLRWLPLESVTLLSPAVIRRQQGWTTPNPVSHPEAVDIGTRSDNAITHSLLAGGARAVAARACVCTGY